MAYHAVPSIYIVYTYVQPCCKKLNTATYIHTCGVSNAYCDITLFIRSQSASTEQPERGLMYREMEKTAFCSTAYGGKGILFIRRGLAYRKTEETDLLRSKQGSC